MDREFKIRFGPFIIVFLCKNKEVIDSLKLHYHEYISDLPPSVSIVMTVIPSVKTTLIKTGTRYNYFIDRQKFNFGPDLIEGRWDKRRRIWHLCICKSLFTIEDIWLFNRFLCSLFYSLFFERRTKKNEALIIHGSGVLKDDKGYIFFGPAGSGKSTVAHLSRDFKVLHDDMNIVTFDRDNIFIEGIPFNPKQLKHTQSSAPLSMICSLHKNDVVKITRGSRKEFTKKVLPEVFLPLPLLSDDRKGAFQYLLSYIKVLGKKVPYYHLSFTKDNRFWHEIEKKEGDDGRYKKTLCS